MKCCNDYSQCNQNKDCTACAGIKPDWQFCPMQDKPPHTELASDAFYFIGFALILTSICLIAGIGWGLLERFYPFAACLVQMLFSTACK